MTARELVEKSAAEKAEKVIKVSDTIWEYAEGGYQEDKSAEVLCKALEEEGFTVTRNLTGIRTAFKGVWGNGKPVIGILGEFDALPGLSQKAACPVKDPLVEGERGHGCGHNLLGAGALMGAFAVKDYLEETGKEGTVVYFGTPAEEVGSGKTFMARDGAFDGVDFVYTWHPGVMNDVGSTHMVANYSKIYSFQGVTAHAGGAPHLGRSALDSVELMNVGVNYLREHVIQEARIHYAYLDAGGTAPNVVQDHAKIKYVIRAPYIRQVDEITQRIDDIARGAALMCGTAVSWEKEAGYSDYIPNTVLAEVMDEALHEIGAPKWDEEDFKLAKAFAETISDNGKNEAKLMIAKRYGKEAVEEVWAKPLDTVVGTFKESDRRIVTGSTDVGDVGYVAPTTMCSIATEALGTPGHSWQTTAQSNSSIGHKGMLTAGKVIALASIKMLEAPEKIEEAKAEFLLKNDGKYDCPMEAGVRPPEFI